MKTMLFNPYTGRPRHPSDVASDPAGLLTLDPDEPLRAAQLRPLAKIQPTHEVAHAFWRTWREYGEALGYYEATWRAINAAIAAQKEPQ